MLLLGLIILMIISGVPVFYAMLLGLTVFVLLVDPALLPSIPVILSYSFDSFPLLAIPLFILAAEIMNVSGITERIFLLLRYLIGHRRGALGHVNVLCSMLFAGMSGSGVADAAGLGRIEMKAMLEEGYDRKFSAAITASSTTIGPIIPPSIGVVILAYVTNTSVGQLLVAGIVPGILMGLGLIAVVFVISKIRKYPKHERTPFSEVAVAARDAGLAIITPLILISGILFGIFSPTEAATASVAYAVFLGVFVYKTLSVKSLVPILSQTAIATSAILVLGGAAKVIGFLLVMDGIPQQLLSFVEALPLSPGLVIAMSLLLVILLGCVIDDLSLLLILGPILLPLAVQLGYDPIHFSILFLAALTLGMITPPIGLGMFVVCSIAEIKMSEFARELWPFFLVLLLVIFTLLQLPDVVLFLPRMISG